MGGRFVNCSSSDMLFVMISVMYNLRLCLYLQYVLLIITSDLRGN